MDNMAIPGMGSHKFANWKSFRVLSYGYFGDCQVE